MAKDNIFRRVLDYFKPEERSIYIAPTTSLGLPYSFHMPPLSVNLAMQLSAVYRCVEVISDAVASQHWDVLEYNPVGGWTPNPLNKIDYMLNYEPSSSMSRFTLMKTLIAKMLLEGNGFLRIHRNGMGDPEGLELINDTVKTFRRDNGTLYYMIGQPGKEVTVDGEDMIHLLNFTYDGYSGVSTLTHAANSMALAYVSDSSAKGFFSSGANASGIITTEGKVTPEKAQDLKDAWAEAFDINSGTPGGIAVLEKGLDFKPVTVNPKDAQMLETRQFNVIEICRFFGVHPSKVFDSSNLTYSNIESFQLGFLTDTISPLDSKIEAEFNRKLLRPSKRPKTRLNLNISELLRANLDSTANYVSKVFQCGGYTVNEVRSKIGMPKVEGGDNAYVQINLQPVNRSTLEQGIKT